MTFLEKLLPSEGMYCVAMLMPTGGFRHYFYPKIETAQLQLDLLDKAGHTTYIAQATFNTERLTAAQLHNKALPKGHPKTDRKKERSQDNAHLIKNFFLDIDCGEKWPLKNQREAVVELKKFVFETGLPFPAVVNSGNGLYAHWILTEAIQAAQWRTIAYLLKQVVTAYSPKLGGDSSRTSDSASVLRPPGVTNRKEGRPAKPVVLLKDADEILFTDFVDRLGLAAKARKIDRGALLAPKASTDANSEFFVRQDEPGDANRIADKCAQLGLMRSAKGDIVEPMWYACIGVLIFCAEGEEVIQEWSTGHSGYDESQTSSKIRQWQDSGFGPATCTKLAETNPSGCLGCPHKNKIKSPIVLGRPEPKPLVLPQEQQCLAPDGFRRGEGGLFAEDDGKWILFYDQDLYVDRLAFDQSLGYEVMLIRHHLPHEGWLECMLRSSLVHDPKALLTMLSDNHIKVMGMKEKKLILNYIEGYAAKLQRQRKMSHLVCQMGWGEARNGAAQFALGNTLYNEDGTKEAASLARSVPVAAEGYKTKGTLDNWSEMTRVLDKPGMESFAFTLLAGGFGAPLMKFTGFDGAMVSIVGTSGVGKTLMLRMIQSVWGHEDSLMMLRDDTKNALVARLGVYGNLPMTIDEITNIDGIELSDLVYRITQGRDKMRLTKNAEEKRGVNSWNTLAVTSSNSSLIDKLSGAKHDASAEMNRVFEYPISENPNFRGDATKDVYWTIQDNYGHAGQIYAAYIVQHVGKIKEDLEKIRAKIATHAGITGEERFWGAVASVAIYGGLIAFKLGLIKFNITPVYKWVSDTIRRMRSEKTDLTGDSLGILGQFIDDHAANRILVRGEDIKKGPGCLVVEAPRGQLMMRYELDTHRLFISRNEMRRYITQKYGSYTKIKNDLMHMRVLINPGCMKVLGAGTYWAGAQQPCWEVNIRSSKLEEIGISLKKVTELLANAPVKEFGKP